MQMPTNSKKNDSLRACGAFKAPSVLLKKGEIDLTEEYEEQAEYLVGLVEECSRNFMENYDIDEYVIEDVKKIFSGTTYGDVVCSSILFERINGDRTLKGQVFNLMTRVDALESGGIKDDVYERYLSDLYLYNSGKGKKLGSLYSMVKKSVIQWCGSDTEGNIKEVPLCALKSL